jgi:uncharacterized protein YecE (DUF72 family)
VAGRVLIGTQGWNYAAWVGPFYPEGTRPADMLTRYAEAFPTVEVDSTFYAIPPESSVLGWARRTPDDFVFSLKLTRDITHERRLRDAQADTELFLERARLLGPRLGPILVQLGPDFAPSELPALEAFVPTLPADLRFAVELRQERWMRDDVLPKLLRLLSDHGIALALSDGPWLPRDAVLDLAAAPTADFHYLRWMGPNRDLVDYSHVQISRDDEIEEWLRVLQGLLSLEIDVYGYVNNHFEGHSPATARGIQRRLGIRPVDPREIGEQTTLF